MVLIIIPAHFYVVSFIVSISFQYAISYRAPSLLDSTNYYTPSIICFFSIITTMP
ncbi:hypothetical protein BCR42DRAFT_414027, partial [Absidia repens]